MTYDVRKAMRGNFYLLHRFGEDGSHTLIDSFKTRKEAILTARLLAGWRGLVTVNGKAI